VEKHGIMLNDVMCSMLRMHEFSRSEKNERNTERSILGAPNEFANDIGKTP
jgi:hypothetical protein